MSNYYVYDRVAHSGIKGMKWGLRRYQNKDGTYTEEGKARRRSEDGDRSIQVQRRSDMKRIRSMSNEELAEKIGRLSSEKKLRDLLREDTEPGKAETRKILKSVGEKIAVGAIAGAGVYAIKAAMTKNFDVKEFASYVAANPNKKK